MRRLFAAAGVDFEQWKAMTVVALKLDFRGSGLTQRQGEHETRVVISLIFQAIFYTLFGGIIAYLVWASRDLWLAGTIASTYIAFLIGTAVVLDHHSVISSPLDYAILGFRPVSSRTYFAVKLTNILVYTTALTTVAAWVPVLLTSARHGVGIGAALFLDIYASSTATTLAIALSYATVLRAVGPDAIERVLSYVQLIMGFAVYGGQFLISGVLSRTAPGTWSLPAAPLILLYPGTWFGSYLELASGRTSAGAIACAAASIVAVVLMGSQLGGRLSLQYSEALGAMTVAARARAASAAEKRSRRGFWFASGEARAVALLVRGQFRHDHRFRMGVLGLLPFTVLYMVLGVRNGVVADPFTATRNMQAWPLTMAVLASPAMLRMLLTRSDAFRASWIFFTCPSDRMRIARSSKDVLVAFFLIPYLLVVSAIYAYVVGNVVHVLVHIAFLGLLAHLVLQIALLLDPALPFSRPMQQTRVTGFFLAFTFATILVSLFVQFYSVRIYGDITWTIAAVAIIVLIGFVIDLLTRARVSRQAQLLEFEG
jgi:ABC-2 type transport system permease protein